MGRATVGFAAAANASTACTTTPRRASEGDLPAGTFLVPCHSASERKDPIAAAMAHLQPIFGKLRPECSLALLCRNPSSHPLLGIVFMCLSLQDRFPSPARAACHANFFVREQGRTPKEGTPKCRDSSARFNSGKSSMWNTANNASSESLQGPQHAGLGLCPRVASARDF